MVSRRMTIAATAVLVALGATTAAANEKNIKSRELEVERAGMTIALYEKWVPGEEQKLRENGKVVLLVHGATWSSKCTFDPIEGYSLMDSLAERGWDVFAIDLHNYGPRSTKTKKDWTEAASAAEDIDAAVDYIRALRWVEKIHILGYQWGTQPAGLFAMKKPNKVAKLVLFGPRYNNIEKYADPTTQFRANSLAAATLKPDDGDLDPEFVRRRAQICMQQDAKSPNGAVRDLIRQNDVDPEKLSVPTLVLHGDRDYDALPDRMDFFKALKARNRWFVVLPGMGKYANIEKKRERFEAAVASFLEMP